MSVYVVIDTTHSIVLLSLYSINYMLSLNSQNYFDHNFRKNINFDVRRSNFISGLLVTLKIAPFSNIFIFLSKN